MDYIKKIKPFFIDDRGEMSKLIDGEAKITSVLFITCKKGAIRANHYHKKDTHYSYLVSGKMQYTWKDVNSKNGKKNSIVVYAGEIIYTPSMTAHAMKFLENSVFIALATEPRDQEDYEEDTIKVDLI